MIPELGHFALVLALCLALVQAVVPLVGATRGIPSWMAVGRAAAIGQFVFLAVSFAALTQAFIVNDFSVLYVASNSNSLLPLMYRISAVWGAHEGSLLLWGLILGGWTAAVAVFSRSLPHATVARVLAVMGMVSVGFLLFILLTSNPFERLVPPAMDGRDLNPLLQDPGLVIHPPMLYMGYVGFSVAFAFAVAALIGGKLDAAWARWSRPWTAIAWVFLTIGIALGSWWAYYELGWGGWWFWDPVENASFMPWLVGTALLHSLAVVEKRGAFKSWTVLLAIFAFSLSLLGTFLVRSGVLTSVHAFATDPERGVFILMFLAVVVGGSLALYAWRAPAVSGGGNFQLVSRETALLVNNVLLVVAAATILLGTIYPLVLDALSLGKISVGPPYFDLLFTILMVPLLFLLGFGPLLRWKQHDPAEMVRQMRYMLGASVVLAVLYVAVVRGTFSIMVILGVALALWIVTGVVTDLRSKLRHKTSVWRGLRSLPRGYYGMQAAHIGVAVFTIGVTLTSTFSIEKDLRMAPGDVVELGGYSFQFFGVHQAEGPNYTAFRGTVRVDNDGDLVGMLSPEKRNYHVQRMPMTEAAIDAGLFRDIYVALGEPLPDNKAWAVRLYVKPFVRWIWLGAIFMAIGGLLAATDKRYRIALRQRSEAPTGAAAAAAGG